MSRQATEENIDAHKISEFFLCVKSVSVRGYLVRIQSECGKLRTRITSNTDTFHAVFWLVLQQKFTSSKSTIETLKKCMKYVQS